MQKRLCSAILLLLHCVSLHAQFAPQYPLPGNEAIPSNDMRIKGWATACTFTRGWKNIQDTSLGKTTAGSATSPLGPPGPDVLSLGDGGSAILTFGHPIQNGEGPDFAIFENGFGNPLDPALAYLEFAFVEVSSDGAHYFRFPATSNIQDSIQIDNFTYMDASLVDNLAGKYIDGYGTPFDLEALKNEPGLDVQDIRYVKVIDVVGSIDSAYATFDRNGHIINCPFPSPYPTGGFDLNAVAVLNQQAANDIHAPGKHADVRVFPNPARDFIFLENDAAATITYALYDVQGTIRKKGTFTTRAAISLKQFSPGIYFLEYKNGEHVRLLKIIIQQ